MPVRQPLTAVIFAPILVAIMATCRPPIDPPPPGGIPSELRGRGFTIAEGMDGDISWRVGLVVENDSRRSCLWLEGWRTQSSNVCFYIAGVASAGDLTHIPTPSAPVTCSYMINSAPSASVRDPIQGRAWLILVCSKDVETVELDGGDPGTYPLEQAEDPRFSTIVTRIPPRQVSLTLRDARGRAIDELHLDAVAAAAGPAAKRIHPRHAKHGAT